MTKKVQPDAEIVKLGNQITVVVQGFEPFTFESKDPRYDLGMVMAWHEEHTGAKMGPLLDVLHEKLENAEGRRPAPQTNDATDPELLRQAEEWLSSPGLLYHFEGAICAKDSSDFLIGEENNAIYLLLLILAKESVEVGGNSAGGKNSLVDHVLSVIPPNWYTKLTGLSDKAIRYLSNDVRILYIAERRGLKSGEESTAEYDMKVSMSEGKLVVAYASSDEGTVETKFNEVHIDQFILTSTDIQAPPELENRLSRISIRDDSLQNERVRDEQLRRSTRFSWQVRDYSRERVVGQAVIDIIDKEAPEHVVIPYANALKPVLDIENTAVRRNTPKLLQAIRACAKLHFKQRPIVPGADGSRNLIALPLDLMIVLSVGASALRQTLSMITEKMTTAVELCAEIVNKDDVITTRSILQLAKEKRVTPISSLRTVQDLMKPLEERGILGKRYDEEGKLIKADHGLHTYDLIGSPKNLVLDEQAILQEADKAFESWCDSNEVRPCCRPRSAEVSRPSQTKAENHAEGRDAPEISAPRPIAPDSNPEPKSAESVGLPTFPARMASPGMTTKEWETSL